MTELANKIALFIDGANTYAAAKTLGFDIDYKRLLKEFQGRGILVRAFYYTAIIEDQEFSSIRPLIDWLDYNGFTVVTKASKEFIDADGRRQGEGQHGHRAYRGCDGTRRARRRDHAIFWRRRFPLLGRSRATSWRPRHRHIDDLQPSADDSRQIAPSG